MLHSRNLSGFSSLTLSSPHLVSTPANLGIPPSPPPRRHFSPLAPSLAPVFELLSLLCLSMPPAPRDSSGLLSMRFLFATRPLLLPSHLMHPPPFLLTVIYPAPPFCVRIIRRQPLHHSLHSKGLHFHPSSLPPSHFAYGDCNKPHPLPVPIATSSSSCLTSLLSVLGFVPG